jgi:hypothetical protein
MLCIPAIIMVVRTWSMRGETTRKTFLWVFLTLLIAPPWVMAFLTYQKAYPLINGLLYAMAALLGLYWIRWWMIRPKY